MENSARDVARDIESISGIRKIAVKMMLFGLLGALVVLGVSFFVESSGLKIFLWVVIGGLALTAMNSALVWIKEGKTLEDLEKSQP